MRAGRARGAGKTETAKDLANALMKLIYIITFSKGLYPVVFKSVCIQWFAVLLRAEYAHG